MGSVYTVSQLLALRNKIPLNLPLPEEEETASKCRLGSYFALWRKYMDLLTEGPQSTGQQYPVIVVYKYDFLLSNKEFKRQWVKSHGTSAGLKDLPRRKVNLRSIRVKYLEDYFKTITRLETRLQNLYRKIHSYESPPKRTVVSEIRGVVKPSKYVPPHKRPTKKERRKAFRVTPISHGGSAAVNMTIVGGTSVFFKADEPPVRKDWTKYWYFYRKHGRWRPSEHHPYGDETIHLAMDRSDL